LDRNTRSSFVFGTVKVISQDYVLCVYMLRPNGLVRVQKECDLAITRAIDARKSTTQEADLQFEDAIKALESYNEDYLNRWLNY
jgi:hypothetical protein